MRKLYRTEIDNVFGGVCGGFGEYFDIDPSILRIIFICLIFFPFPIILTIAGGAFWLGDKMNKDDRYKTNSRK